MIEIERRLGKHKCKSCSNLGYWDGFFCKKGKHKTKKEKLSRRPLKECPEYAQRIGCANYEAPKDQECVFFCNDCPVYQNNPVKKRKEPFHE